MLADEANTLILFKFQYQIGEKILDKAHQIVSYNSLSWSVAIVNFAKKPVVPRRSKAMISCNLPCAAKMKTTDHGVTPRLFAQDKMQEL